MAIVVGRNPDLWSLVLRPGEIDEQELWEAVCQLPISQTTDYRTGLLAHEALRALADRWGERQLLERIDGQANAAALHELWRRSFDQEPRFPSLRSHVVRSTTSESILRMLRDLGARLHRPARISVGGSSALILARLLVRRTEDIDVVDELPEAVRTEPALLDELAGLHKLRLTHFASHYLPDGWHGRTSTLGRFGRLEVYLLDPLDVLCGKLFSRRSKDLEDVQASWSRIDTSRLRERLRRHTAALRSIETDAEAARHNWYVLSGEEALP